MALQGCAAITRDLRHPGGAPGRFLDKRTFDASDSKEVQLLRFAIVLAMAARMSGETVRTTEHAHAVAEHLAATANEINRTAANLYPVEGAVMPGPCSIRDMPSPPLTLAPRDQVASLANRLDAAVAKAELAAQKAAHAEAAAVAADLSIRQGIQGKTINLVAGAGPPPPPPTIAAPTHDCNGYFVNFEADVPLIEYPLINLVLATLPRDQLKDFADDLEKGNVLGGAFSLLKVVFIGVKGLHTAAGTYRTAQEALVVNGVDCSRLAKKTFVEERSTVKLAVACLGLSPDTLFGPHPDEVTGEQITGDISAKTFEALMFIARTSCVRLPIGAGDNDIVKLTALRKQRQELCGQLYFKPIKRIDFIETK